MVSPKMTVPTRLAAIGLFAGYAALAHADQTAAPVELGDIHWSRDFDAATAQAKREKKPILILFQEVPGCATCRTYGKDVLSHPLIREAAEDLFIPVAIYNNIEGKDRRVLQSFDEPTWNNPVVRIVDADRKALAERVNGDYSAAGLVKAMVTALKASKRTVPSYLELLHDELNARQSGKLEQATFAMHCFWEGEVQFGKLDSVIATQAGWLNKEEVVDVWFDSTRIEYQQLVKAARKVQCARRVYARNPAQQKTATPMVGDAVQLTNGLSRPDGEPKYYLGKSLYRFVPMTPIQTCRANAALRDAQTSPDSFLSNAQLRLLSAIRKHPQAGWPISFNTKDFAGSMKKAAEIAKTSAAKA